MSEGVNFFGGYKARKYEVVENFKSHGVAEIANIAIPVCDTPPVNDCLATGVFTITKGQNASGKDTVTIGNITYTFVSTLENANEVKIGANSEGTISNLQKAIVGGEGKGTVYSSDTDSLADVTDTVNETDSNKLDVSAKIKGEAGNSIVTTSKGSEISWGNETLTGGVDNTIGKRGINFIDENAIYICVDDNNNWKKIELSDL